MATEQELLFEQAKAYLMRSDAEGNSVYDHLHSMVSAMLEENPNDVAHHPERFAEVSSAMKRHAYIYGDATLPTNNPQSIDPSRVERAKQNKKLFEKPEPEVVTKVEKPTPFTTVTTTTVTPKSAPGFTSVVSENQMWQYCGVGLPQEEAFLLDQSITKLALQKKLEEVRFFGKILGTKKNYFVVSSKRYTAEGEVVYDEINEMPKPPRKKVEVDIQPEPAYKGVNRVSFWVTSDPSSEWVLLPDITPQEVNAVRKIKKFFTGELDAPLVSYPDFEGDERLYLRAQLARISSATYISPVNALEKVEPEDEEEAEDEEGAKKGPKPAKYLPLTRINKEYAPDDEAGVAALLDTEQWCHSEGYIYETGRQTKVPPKPETDEEEEQKDEDEEEENEDEKKEEEERELFLPVKKDSVYAIIHLPKEPNPEEDGEEEAEAEAEPEGEGEEKEEKEEDEDEIADDDPLRKKISSWNAKLTNAVYKKHAVVVVRSLRWPGAVAYAAAGGKKWGSVYFGFGFKKTDFAFAPVPAPEILKECDDIAEVRDPTAANEKLVIRGEEPKEADSEDEKEEEEVEEEQ